MQTGYKYSFPAIRGVQAKKAYYVAMCPLSIVPKIFQSNDEDLLPEFRAQRILNKSRIPDIARYIIDNPEDYVFSSLTASVDGEMEFISYNNGNLGELVIPMEAKFLINDGQHRRAAIEDALKHNPDLNSETISIVFFEDRGLKKSQQMFADLNKHAINTTKSIGILYDNRDPLSLLTKRIIDTTPLLKNYTDKEVDSLSKLSPKIFTLTNIHNSICRILSKKKGDTITEEEELFVSEYWQALCSTIKEWRDVQSKSLSAADLRKNYVHAHGVVLEALGLLGNYFYKNCITDYKKYIKKLNNIDWNRLNLKDWVGRAIKGNGTINKNTDGIKLTYSKIKDLIGLELSAEERQLEEILLKQSGEIV